MSQGPGELNMSPALPSGAQPQESGPGQFSMNDSRQWLTGQNRQGQENGWDTPFYRKFITDYQRAMDDGSARDYFKRNDVTGIVMWSQQAHDGRTAQVGDVYNEGRFVGNLYNQYDQKSADLILGRLMLSANEQARITDEEMLHQAVQARAIETERNAAAALTREDFDARVKAKKDEWDDTATAATTVAAGAAGGALWGAGIGSLIPVVGTGIGAAVGGLVGGLSALANVDEIEDMAARGDVMAEMAYEGQDKSGSNTGAWLSQQLQSKAGLLGEFTNPLKQTVHGITDLAAGEWGDEESAYYAVDPDTGQSLRPGWLTAIDLGANVAGAAGQFATVPGRLVFQGQMIGQIGGKVSTLISTGGETFDERRGQFDNVFLDDDGKFNLQSSVGGLGDVGIDLLQLGMGRGMMRVADRTVGATATTSRLGETSARIMGKQSLRGGSWENVGGMNFRVVDGVAKEKRLAISALVPSEMTNLVGMRATAMAATRKAGRELSVDDLYQAAKRIQTGQAVRPAVVVNAFGEGTEEALQTVFEAWSHGAKASLEEIAESAMYGAAMGAGMTLGTYGGFRTRDNQMRDQARVYAGLNNDPNAKTDKLWQAHWDSLNENQKADAVAIGPETYQEARKLAAQVAQNERLDMVASEQGVEWYVDWQHRQVAKSRAGANDMTNGTFVITKAQWNIADHEMVASFRTVAEMFRQRLQAQTAMIEQARREQPPYLQRLERRYALLSQLVDAMNAGETEYYDENTDLATKQQIIGALNDQLQSLWNIQDASVADQMDDARVVSWTFTRSPIDNDGSFPLYLPQIGQEISDRGDFDGLLHVSLGQTEGAGADFDGDKMQLDNRIDYDDVAFLNARLGNYHLTAIQNKQVGIMTREFEKAQITKLHEDLLSSNAAIQKNARDTLDSLRRILTTPAYLGGILDAEVARFLDRVQEGVPTAKEKLLQEMAQKPELVQQRAAEKAENLWLKVNTAVQQELQMFQFTSARVTAQETPTKIKSSIATPMPLERGMAEAIARQAATFTQTLDLEAVGGDLFRKWQKLHYSAYNAPITDWAGWDQDTALQEMTAFYELLNARMTDSAADRLRAGTNLTSRVVKQLKAMAAEYTSITIGNLEPSLPVLASIRVPEIANGKFTGKTTTLLKELFLRSVAVEERLEAANLERDPSLAAKFSRLRSMGEGRAFVEVFGAYTFDELLPVADASVFGRGYTVNQWFQLYVNQDDFSRNLAQEALHSHASYVIEGPTSFKFITEALLDAGNHELSWNKGANHGRGEVTGRIGQSSNRTHGSFVSAIERLQSLASSMSIANTPQAWQQMFDTYAPLGRAFMNALPDEIGAVAFKVVDGKLRVANWVYTMMTLPPEEAVMEYWRQTLLSSWNAQGSGKADSDEITGRSYYKLSDRFHRLMYQLNMEGNPLKLARFEKALYGAKNLNEFIAEVNNNFRGNEAPYTAWHRDVSEVDPMATQGGWSKVLENSNQRQALRDFERAVGQFQEHLKQEDLNRIADDETAIELTRQVNGESDRQDLAANLDRALRIGQRYRDSLAPGARRRLNAMIMFGAFGSTTDKGKAVTGVAVEGVYDSHGDHLLFGTTEEQAMASLTSNSVANVQGNPRLLLEDSWSFIDDDGTVVEFDKMTPQTFVEKWNESPDNHPLLLAMLHPAAYEHVGSDRLERQFLMNTSLTSLIVGDTYAEILTGNSRNSVEQYNSVLSAMTEDHAFEQAVTEISVAYTSAMQKTLGFDAAYDEIKELNFNLGKFLRLMPYLVRQKGEYELIDNDGVLHGTVDNAADYVAWRVKRELWQRYRGEFFGNASMRRLYDLAQEMWVLEQANVTVTAETAEEIAQQDLETAMMQVGTKPQLIAEHEMIRAVLNKLALPKKTKTWQDDTLQTRVRIATHIRENPQLLSSSFNENVIRIMNHKGDPATNLPDLTYDQWEDAAAAVVADTLMQLTSATVPSEMPGKLGKLTEDNLRLWDPTWSYLVDPIMSSDSSLVKAAVALQSEFDGPAVSAVSEEGVIQLALTTLFPADKLGTHSRLQVHQTEQGLDRLLQSGTPQGIATGGLAPQRETTEGMATRRTDRKPLDDTYSTVALNRLDLQSGLDHVIGISRPRGQGMKLDRLQKLHGRFARSVKINGQEVLNTQHTPGESFYVKGVNHGLQAITIERLRKSVEDFVHRNSVRGDVNIEIEFLHPDDIPALSQQERAQYANNVWYEGLVQEAGDKFPSLDAAWFVAGGGVDASTSARALQAAKKKLQALFQGTRFSSEQNDSFEQWWRTDLSATIEAKTYALMHADLGGGRKIDPVFYNSAVKRMKMRHFVRGLGADGKVRILSAEEAIAWQQANSGKDISELFQSEPELYLPSDSALRTMLGERGTQGERRMLETIPRSTDVDPLSIARWQGTVTDAHISQLPGIASLEKRDLFKTRAARMGYLRKMNQMSSADNATRESFVQGHYFQQRRAQDIEMARMQANDSSYYKNKAIEILGRYKSSLVTQAGADFALSAMHANLRANPVLQNALNKAILSMFEREITKSTNMTGFVYEPMSKATGQDYNLGVLSRFLLNSPPVNMASQVAPNDVVVINLDGYRDMSPEDAAKDLRAALKVLMGYGARVILAPPESFELNEVARTYLRDHGYDYMAGSRSVYQPADPVDTPISERARFDHMMETHAEPGYNRIAMFHTSDFGLEENTAIDLLEPQHQRTVSAADIIPRDAYAGAGFVYPLQEDMAAIRMQLGNLDAAELMRLVTESSGGKRKLSDRELQTKTEELRLALEKAATHLNDNGWYNLGTEFKTGDIIPLYDRERKRLLLYRHGYKPLDEGQLKHQLSMSNGKLALYGMDPLPSATTKSGTVVRFEKDEQYGLRVRLQIPLQRGGDKVVIEGGGFKIIPTLFKEWLSKSRGRQGRGDKDRPDLKLPAPMRGRPVNYVLGISDTRSKENYIGMHINFRNMFGTMGVDFRPDIAKAVWGENYTEDQLSQVDRLMQWFRVHLPKLNVSAVNDMIQGLDPTSQLNSFLMEAEMPEELASVSLDQVRESVEDTAPESQILRAALVYLMADGARPEHILYSGGLGATNSYEHGVGTRMMPEIFTQVFDRSKMTSALRNHVIAKMQERFDNPNELNDEGQQVGYFLNNDLSVTIVNRVAEYNARGWLQFAEANTSGDNPVINLMAQARPDRQVASAQQASMAALTMGVRMHTDRGMEGLKALLNRENVVEVKTGEDLMGLVRAIPTDNWVEARYVLTQAEREYLNIGRSLVAGLRQPLDTEAWFEGVSKSVKSDMEAEFMRLKVELVRGYGLTAEDHLLVDYWIRQHLYKPQDLTPKEEGGNTGFVSFDDAKEIIDFIRTQNMAKGLLPVADGDVPLMHSLDLRAIHRANQGANPVFRLRTHAELPRYASNWDEWVKVALSIGSNENEWFDPIALTAADGFLHTYRNEGIDYSELPLSQDKFKRDTLMDPRTSDTYLSIESARRAGLRDVQLIAMRTDLDALFGGTKTGLAWKDSNLNTQARSQQRRKRYAWRKEQHNPMPLGRTSKDFLEKGQRFVTESTSQNAALRTVTNLRAGMALTNPMLFFGAPVEGWIQEMTERAANLATGKGQVARGDQDLFKSIYRALGSNQTFKGMIGQEFKLESRLHDAGAIERLTHKFAQLGGRFQDPYWGMKADTVAKRYVHSVIRGFLDMGTMTNMTPERIMRELSTNPQWVQQQHPAIHKMAINTLKEIKNVKATTISSAFNGLLNPITESSRWGANLTGTLMRLQFMFLGYTANKAIQILGLQGLDQILALSLHGRRNKVFGRIQAAIAGRDYDPNEEIDMSDVIETLDVTSAIAKSGMTHAGLMALGLMSGGLGLSGEDEEDRRRRKAAYYQGFGYLYDPRDIVNDFRNADAIYLDAVPFFGDVLGEWFRVTDPSDPGGARAMAQMNWVVKQVVSPIIGMERFFNTGDPREVWWGFEDAFYSFPLVNTTLVSDAGTIWAEVSASAADEDAKGGPDNSSRAFDLLVKGVMRLEGMLLEHGLINAIYQASDMFDRDAWVQVERRSDGSIMRDKLGNPKPLTALQDRIDEDGNAMLNEDGTVMQSYVGRDWWSATAHGYAENRLTFALLAGMFTGQGVGGGDFNRHNMAVKTRKVDKELPEKDQVKATMWSMWKGALEADDPKFEGYYVPLEMRKEIQADLMDYLIKEGMSAGLDERAATDRMWKLWKGDSSDPTSKPLKDVVYSENFSYKQTDRYYQLNTTYVMGPDGNVWATGVHRNDWLNLAGMLPLQRYATGDTGGLPGTDSVLNNLDPSRNINLGMRSLMKVPDDVENPSESDILKAMEDAIRKVQQLNANNGYTPYQKWGNGYRRYGRGGGGGGGRGSSSRIYAPPGQQAPYANNAQAINTTNPILRRATIRRERVDSQKGRLKPWQ